MRRAEGRAGRRAGSTSTVANSTGGSPGDRTPREPIGRLSTERGGPGRKSGHVTRKRLLPRPARLRAYARTFGPRAGGCLGFPVVGGRGSEVPFVDPAVRGREGQDREERSLSSDNSPCPKRVGRGGVTAGDDGEGKRGSAAPLGKTSQLCRGARARVQRAFCNYPASRLPGIWPVFPVARLQP